jgi:hypothetical protein
MSVIYNTNYDVELNLSNIATAVGFSMKDLSVGYFFNEAENRESTEQDRSGAAFTVEDDDCIVYMTMTFGDPFMPMEAFKKFQVHRKIFRSTIRTLYKKHTTPKLQKFLVAMFDDMSRYGWEVAVFLDTPNKIPMVQFYHPASQCGIVPLPTKKKRFLKQVEEQRNNRKAGIQGGAYQTMVGHLANS